MMANEVSPCSSSLWCVQNDVVTAINRVTLWFLCLLSNGGGDRERKEECLEEDARGNLIE